MKKTLFVVGLLSGVVLSRTWKTLTKEGIKVGIKAGRKFRELSQQAIEDIEDIAAEASEEVSQKGEGARW
ncbi:MAG: hypothetical protein ICV68_00660 [Pyrinomonadaceae bacterium]|nr:hypothetical protein [Pyrinomonadaceae bacterium]